MSFISYSRETRPRAFASLVEAPHGMDIPAVVPRAVGNPFDVLDQWERLRELEPMASPLYFVLPDGRSTCDPDTALSFCKDI